MKSIEESNRLIAEFDGWVFGKYDNLPYKAHKIINGEEIGLHISQFSYHKDWNELWNIIDKIIDFDITPAPNWSGYKIEIVPRGYVKISGFPMPPIFSNVSIEGSVMKASYKAVVQFIEYYNSTHPCNP